MPRVEHAAIEINLFKTGVLTCFNSSFLPPLSCQMPTVRRSQRLSLQPERSYASDEAGERGIAHDFVDF